VSGIGTLSWWNAALNHGHGGCQTAATAVTYTATLTATTKTTPAIFGIEIAYTPSAGQPTPLPNSGPTILTSGGDRDELILRLRLQYDSDVGAIGNSQMKQLWPSGHSGGMKCGIAG
jgi:hypothetical protein